MGIIRRMWQGLIALAGEDDPDALAVLITTIIAIPIWFYIIPW